MTKTYSPREVSTLLMLFENSNSDIGAEAAAIIRQLRAELSESRNKTIDAAINQVESNL